PTARPATCWRTTSRTDARPHVREILFRLVARRTRVDASPSQGEAMRSIIAGGAAVAFCASCGGSSSPPASAPAAGAGKGGPTQMNLKITTSGNGLVRGAGSDCRGVCTVSYDAGTQVHLAAVPDPGSSFAGWAGACGGTSGCDLTLDSDREVSATFTAAPPPPPGQRHLMVVIQGKGRVTS